MPTSSEEMLAFIMNQRHRDEDTIERFVERHLLEERPASRTHCTPSVSSARIEEFMYDQIAKFRALVEDVLKRVLGDTGQITLSSSKPAMIKMIRITVDQSVANDY